MFANPFDILGDENEDSSNVPAKPTQPKTAKAPAKPKDTKPAAPKPAASKPAANGAAAKPATSAAKPAAPKTEQKGDAQKPAAPKPQQAGGQQVAKGPAPVRDSNANLEEKNKEYHRGGADKRDRPRQPAGAPGRDKRVYDRKSGTGRPATENKKGGEGKANWGGEVDVREATEALKDEKSPATAADEEKEEEGKEGEKTEGEKKEGEEEKKDGEKKEEEKKKEIGLDEYLKTLKAKAPKNVEAHKPRTVTTDDFESAGFVALKRDDDDDKKKKEKKEKKTEKKEGEKKDGAEKKEKSLAEKLIAFPTYRNEQRRDDRGPRENRGGDRRSPRPERFEGQGRNDRRPYPNAQPASPAPAQAAVAADYKSSKDFPTLAPHAAPAAADQPVKA